MPGQHIEAEDLTPKVNEEARRALADRLANVTASHGVRLLYACVTGSRAFGWAAPTSDWDVRFIFAHAPARYITLGEPPQDVIEQPLDVERVEIVGWDVRKALRLALRSNLTLHDWLASPLMLTDCAGFQARAAALLGSVADRRVMARQHLSVAQRIWQQKLSVVSAPGGPVTLGDPKPYLHLARAVLSAHWLLSHHALPPVTLPALAGLDSAQPKMADALPRSVSTALAELIANRRQGEDAPADEAHKRAVHCWTTGELHELPLLLAAPGSGSAEDTAAHATAQVIAEQLFHSAIGFTGARRP